jgi:hypothetical protein
MKSLYMSNYMICIEDQKFPVPVGYRHMGQLYSAALIKNRYGPRCVSPIVLFEDRFVSVENAPYWDCTSEEVQTSMPVTSWSANRIVCDHRFRKFGES